MFNKGCICWWKELWRYQNAWYNNKKTVEGLQPYICLVKQLKTKTCKITITDVEVGAREECGCDGIYVSIISCIGAEAMYNPELGAAN